MRTREIITSSLVVTILCAGCGQSRRNPVGPDVNDALGADGVERYCGLGRMVPDRSGAVLPRLSLLPDGRARMERIVVRPTRAPRAYPSEFAPGVTTAAWRGPGSTRLSIERVNPRLILSERGLKNGIPPPWLVGGSFLDRPGTSARRALRLRVLAPGQQRPGPAETLISCASLGPELAADLGVAPAWPLEASLAGFGLRERGAKLDLFPHGWFEPRLLTADDRFRRWCAIGFEYDSFQPNRLRSLHFSATRALVREHHRAPPSVVDVEAAVDGAGEPFLVDVNRAGETLGWFRDCDDERVRRLSGLAF